ncbi:MAG: hypothetical protein ACP5IL_07675 [Syntrophobacteraceae bacterium]
MRFCTFFSFLIVILLTGLPYAYGQNPAQSVNDLADPFDVMENSGNPVDALQDMTHTSVSQAQAGGQGAQFFAPLGIVGAQSISPGQWLTGFTYGHMSAEGIVDGTGSQSMNQVWKKYMMAPETMDVDSYMLCIMRGLTDNFSVMAMIPYYFKDMVMLSRKDKVFAAETNGLGDVQLAGLYNLYESAINKVVFYGGFSAPTGSIDERGDTPIKANAKLPYVLQLGSGTPDLHPGLTYMGKWGSVRWGGQAMGIVRIGYNWDDYRYSDVLELNGWGGYELFDGVLLSLRLNYLSCGRIDGADPSISPMMAPGTDPSTFGADRLFIFPGLTWNIDQGPLKGNKFLIEGGVPVYQYTAGPQGDISFVVLAGWRWVF